MKKINIRYNHEKIINYLKVNKYFVIAIIISLLYSLLFLKIDISNSIGIIIFQLIASAMMTYMGYTKINVFDEKNQKKFLKNWKNVYIIFVVITIILFSLRLI